jgi:hypothetical protein
MIRRILSIAVVLLLAAAVIWQTIHLIDWAYTLYVASGDGTISSYLRWHAHVYLEWFFGNDYAWRPW